MLLLWTERPVPIARELETHRWMLTRRPWEAFGLDLIYDHEPGDWLHYSAAFRSTWRRAARERTGFVNVESDVVPTMRAFRAVLECPEDLCMVVNPIFDFRSGELLGYSAVSEHRVPGGWDAHLTREGEIWAEYADLGFVKFGPNVCAHDIGEVPELTANDGMLNMAVFSWLRERHHRPLHLIHLHWPAIKNNHLGWDAGDYAHHPPGFVSPYER